METQVGACPKKGIVSSLIQNKVSLACQNQKNGALLQTIQIKHCCETNLLLYLGMKFSILSGILTSILLMLCGMANIKAIIFSVRET